MHHLNPTGRKCIQIIHVHSVVSLSMNSARLEIESFIAIQVGLYPTLWSVNLLKKICLLYNMYDWCLSFDKEGRPAWRSYNFFGERSSVLIASNLYYGISNNTTTQCNKLPERKLISPPYFTWISTCQPSVPFSDCRDLGWMTMTGLTVSPVMFFMS